MTVSTQDELEWERNMVDRGVTRFITQRERAVEGNRVSETSAGKTIMKEYLVRIAEAVTAYLNGETEVRRAPEAKILVGMDANKIAYIALKSMLSCVYQADRTYTSVCADIGSKIEDEFHFMQLETENKPYYDQVLRAVSEKATQHYGFIRRSILSAAKNNTAFEPTYWTQPQRVLVGLIIAQTVLGNTDLFEVRHGFRANQVGKWGKAAKFLVPSAECLTWVNAHDDAMAMLFPDRLPMLTPPDPWTTPSNGGYLLPELRHTTPLIIRSRLNPQAGLKKYAKAEMPKVYRAVNAMQGTPWKINRRVLWVMQEVWANNLGVGMPNSEPYTFPPCPLAPGAQPSNQEETDAFDTWKNTMRAIHAQEAERSALCMLVSRNLRLAKELEDKQEFYYVYRCDFRGRVYSASSGISPQGPDQSKALIQFANAKPLGARGVYWLKVHGANKWGYDKSSYDDRVRWIDERKEQWLAVAADPVGNRSLWADADKPYQFLAFCFEYAGVNEFGETFRSHLPVALDGSCNGLQHFSAMLRDQVGGSAVNLVPADKPADIYQSVADVATGKLMVLAADPHEDQNGARNWLRLFRRLDADKPKMPRKLSKKPVMTLPYGSTQNTCTESIFDWYREADGKYFGNTGFKHAIYLSPILWSSIGEVVVAARQAMGWIQKAVGAAAKDGRAVLYHTPLGFPVYQAAMATDTKMVKTAINGGIRLTVQFHTSDLDVRKMRQGASPNFVHSIDASHMMLVLNASLDAGIEDFAMIHDDFGTHACHIDEFHKIIREQFVLLHTESVLDALYIELSLSHPRQEIPNPPAAGTLDINAVKQSAFFFG
jgi:DNA-directed RNA polymerase